MRWNCWTAKRNIEQERIFAADLRRQAQIRKSWPRIFANSHESSKTIMVRVCRALIFYLKNLWLNWLASCIDIGGEAGLRAEPPAIGAEESHHIVKS
jgi:hypothetical protein